MPIKTSGPISIQDIIDEFGGTGSLSDYYRGGDYVPNKNANSAIPVVGSGLPISLGDFYGATKIITLTFKAYGGGGAGGSGFENNSDLVSRAGDGGPTGLMLMSTFDERIDVNGGVVPDVIARDYFIQGAFDLTRDGVIFSPSAAGTFGGPAGSITHLPLLMQLLEKVLTLAQVALQQLEIVLVGQHLGGTGVQLAAAVVATKVMGITMNSLV